MPTKIELLQEAEKRGILPESKRALYDEAVSRGLIKSQKKIIEEPVIRDSVITPETEVISKQDMPDPQFGESMSVAEISTKEPLETEIKPELQATHEQIADIPETIEAQPSHVPGLKPPVIDVDKNYETIKPAIETLKNIGRVYPGLESAANIITSAYGVPVSGLASLFALPFGVEEAEKVRETVHKGLVYEPQTEKGEELTKSVTYPLQKLDEIASAAAKPLSDAGYPDLAATIHTAIVSAPAIVGGKMALSKAPGKVLMSLDKETTTAINKGINKAVRPSVSGKSTSSQAQTYYKKAQTAVKEIVKNKENLELIDMDGNAKIGLPESLNEFSQAVEQTKRNIYNEYDALATEAGGKGVKIDLNKTSKQLKPILKDKNLQDFSPETIEYASRRMEKLEGRNNYSASDAQGAIKLLNQTMEKFYRDPSPQMKGQAFVDSLIANDLRKQLDTAIIKSTGKEYSTLKKKYGALKTIEKDVSHRAIVDARKNTKGLVDFSDIFSGHQIISGMMKADPATMISGSAAKGISSYIKMLNDPNKIVKKMFSEVDKLSKKQATK